MNKKYLFYIIYPIFCVGILISFILVDPVLLLFCMFGITMNAIVYDIWQQHHTFSELEKQVKEDERIVKEKFQIAVRTKSVSEFREYLEETRMDRFTRKMLYEISRRK